MSMLSQLGLIFLLFLVGLEFDSGHLRWHGCAAFLISLVGIAFPFLLGLGLAQWMYPYVELLPRLGFSLFLATALSITALPILGRMMTELNITRTRLGTITISAAAVDDAGGWILLAAVAALARADFNPWRIVAMAGETVGFALLMIILGRPLARYFATRLTERGDGEITINELAALITIVLLCALVTNFIGIFAIFGAFLFGSDLFAGSSVAGGGSSSNAGFCQRLFPAHLFYLHGPTHRCGNTRFPRVMGVLRHNHSGGNCGQTGRLHVCGSNRRVQLARIVLHWHHDEHTGTHGAGSHQRGRDLGVISPVFSACWC